MNCYIFLKNVMYFNLYFYRTLFGTDRNEDHLLVRILSDNIQSTKPMIFIVNLKKYSENILKNLIKILKELTSGNVILLFYIV